MEKEQMAVVRQLLEESLVLLDEISSNEGQDKEKSNIILLRTLKRLLLGTEANISRFMEELKTPPIV